jgi:DNA-directed RNA polymerase subunit RPC12/RpoP
MILCPNCGGKLELHYDTRTGKAYPLEQGDYSICWHCGSKNLYNGHGLVMVTAEIEETMPLEDRESLQREWQDWSRKYSIRGS